MRNTIIQLVSVLTLSMFLFAEATTISNVQVSETYYNVKPFDNIIEVKFYPDSENQTAELTVHLIGLRDNVKQTRLIEVLDENNYLTHLGSYTSDVIDNVSDHRFNIENIRTPGELAKYSIELLDTNGQLINRKSLRFNIYTKYEDTTAPGDGNHLPAVTCRKYKFIGEKAFYYKFNNIQSNDNSEIVALKFCRGQ